jgi:hypothetical protein
MVFHKNKKCPSTREEIVQAVFGVLDEEDATNPCQYRITRENWRNINPSYTVSSVVLIYKQMKWFNGIS